MICIAHKGQTLSKDPFYEYSEHVQLYTNRDILKNHISLIDSLDI